MSEKFRVAICGAGIGGLTLAVTLGKYSNIPIDIYESSSEIGTVGAGLAVWKRTWDVMCRLGLDDEMDKRSIPRPSEGESLAMIFRRSDQPEEGIEINRLVSSYSPIPLHRSTLVDMLKSRLPPCCKVHTGKSLISYTIRDEGGYILQFADGTTHETDVLVGADGVHSIVRRLLFEDLARKGNLPSALSSSDDLRKVIEPQWSGTMVYRSLIQPHKLRAISPDHPVLEATVPFSYSGKGKHIIAYPIANGRLINFLAFDTNLDKEGKPFSGTWASDAPKEEVAELYKGWEPQVEAMIESLDEWTSRRAVHVCSALPVSTSGSVALIGDAVHAMTTHVSGSAGQAIEDAYLLGRLLADPATTKGRVPEAMKIHQDIRLPAANEVVSFSRDVGLMYEFNGAEYDGLDRDNEEALERWRKVILEKWSFQWTGIPEDDWVTAQRQLRRETGGTSGISSLWHNIEGSPAVRI